MLCHLCFELMLRPHTKTPLFFLSSCLHHFYFPTHPPRSPLHPLLVIFWGSRPSPGSRHLCPVSCPLSPSLPFLSKSLGWELMYMTCGCKNVKVIWTCCCSLTEGLVLWEMCNCWFRMGPNNAGSGSMLHNQPSINQDCYTNAASWTFLAALANFVWKMSEDLSMLLTAASQLWPFIRKKQMLHQSQGPANSCRGTSRSRGWGLSRPYLLFLHF